MLILPKRSFTKETDVTGVDGGKLHNEHQRIPVEWPSNECLLDERTSSLVQQYACIRLNCDSEHALKR